MSIEDRVRTATRAGAALVRDIGPLAAPEPSRLRRRPAPKTRRWLSWGVPLAAAAAVVLVAVGLVAVRGAHSGAPATHPATPTAPTTVPRYYVALDETETASGDNAGSRALIVADDLTGQTIATVTPPHGLQFQQVEGGSDDRTFVVVATPKASLGSAPDTWYLLRIAPGTARPYQLAELPVKLPGNSPVDIAYALSPDGRELAIESVSSSGHAGITLAVYSVSSGAELRAWTTGKDIASGPIQQTLSWLSGGRQLAFSDIPPGADQGGPLETQMRTLDLTSSGTDLMSASRAVLTLQSPASRPSNCQSLSLTPDGGTVICGTQYALVSRGPGTNAGCANGGVEFTAYSVRTGKLIRVLYQYRGACHNGISDLLWTGSSASSIVGKTVINVADQGGKQAGQLGVISDGHIRLFKLPKSVSPADYAIAF
jgi:hypothetical protein